MVLVKDLAHAVDVDELLIEQLLKQAPVILSCRFDPESFKFAHSAQIVSVQGGEHWWDFPVHFGPGAMLSRQGLLRLQRLSDRVAVAHRPGAPAVPRGPGETGRTMSPRRLCCPRERNRRPFATRRAPAGSRDPCRSRPWS